MTLPTSFFFYALTGILIPVHGGFASPLQSSAPSPAAESPACSMTAAPHARRKLFSVSPVAGEAPLKVEARGRRAGPPYSNIVMQTQWDFGDGTRVTGTNEFYAEHTYTDPGTYAVRFCPVAYSMRRGKLLGCSDRATPVATVTVRPAQK